MARRRPPFRDINVEARVRRPNRRRRRRGNIASAIMNQSELAIKRLYNPVDFKEHSECSICTSEFTKDSEVTPLPCNPGHYFHSACLIVWLRKSNTCPLCRKSFDPK